MNSDSSQKLVLTTLKNGLPAITPAYGEAMAEAAAVCFEQQNHSLGVELEVTGTFTEKNQGLLAISNRPNASLLESRRRLYHQGLST